MKEKNNKYIKVAILEASDILKNNNDNIHLKKKYNGTMPDSLLLNKLIDMKLNIKNDITRDIVMVNFSYGYTPAVATEYKKTIFDNKEIIDDMIKEKKLLQDEKNNK